MAKQNNGVTIHVSVTKQERQALERLVRSWGYPWTVRSVVRQAIKEKLEKEGVAA